MVPSLCVIFLSGWGVGTENSDNLFLPDGSKSFLGNFVTSYPVLSLASPEEDLDMTDVYKKIGGSGYDADKEFCLSSLLSSHDIRQYKYALPDHYALLTESLRGGCTESFSNEESKFFPYPASLSLKEVPELGLHKLFKSAEPLLNQKEGTVVFMGVGAIKTMAAYKDKQVMAKTISQVDKVINNFVNKALLKGFRVLIVADSGLAESFDQVISKPTIKRTQNHLPCLLIHQNLDGVRASLDDYSVEGVLPNKAVGSLDDVTPTILSLMSIPVPELMKGHTLFQGLIQRTLK